MGRMELFHFHDLFLTLIDTELKILYAHHQDFRDGPNETQLLFCDEVANNKNCIKLNVKLKVEQAQ